MGRLLTKAAHICPYIHRHLFRPAIFLQICAHNMPFPYRIRFSRQKIIKITFDPVSSNTACSSNCEEKFVHAVILK